jgi:hypothetical protein
LQNLPRLWYRTMALQTSTEIYKGEVLHLPRRQPWPMLFPTIAQNRTTLSKHKKNEDHWLFGTISIFHLNSSYSQFPWFRDVIVQNHIRDSTFPPRDGCTPGCQSGSPNSAVPRWARFPRRWHHWRMVFMVKQGIVSHLDYWKSLDKHIFYIIIYIYTRNHPSYMMLYVYI